MKITKEYLKRVIKEEIERLQEAGGVPDSWLNKEQLQQQQPKQVQPSQQDMEKAKRILSDRSKEIQAAKNFIELENIVRKTNTAYTSALVALLASLTGRGAAKKLFSNPPNDYIVFLRNFTNSGGLRSKVHQLIKATVNSEEVQNIAQTNVVTPATVKGSNVEFTEE